MIAPAAPPRFKPAEQTAVEIKPVAIGNDFIRLFCLMFPPGSICSFRPLPIRGEKMPKHLRKYQRSFHVGYADPFVDPQAMARIRQEIGVQVALNDHGLHSYVGICPREQKNSKTTSYDLAFQIRRAHFLWVDIDPPKPRSPGEVAPPLEYADIRKRIADLDLPEPTAIVFTGHGFHLLWKLDETYRIDDAGPVRPVQREWHDGHLLDFFEVEGVRVQITNKNHHLLPQLSPKAARFQNVLRNLSRALGGDATHDLVRILRLAGSRNIKTPASPIPTEIKHFDAEATCNFEKLAEKYDKTPEDEVSEEQVLKTHLPPIRKLSDGRSRKLDPYRDACNTAPVGTRSEVDFVFCKEAIKLGCSREAAWGKISDVGKFSTKNGERYFNQTWGAAEYSVRKDKAEKALQKHLRDRELAQVQLEAASGETSADAAPKLIGRKIANWVPDGEVDGKPVAKGLDVETIARQIEQIVGPGFRAVASGGSPSFLFHHVEGSPSHTLKRIDTSTALFGLLNLLSKTSVDWKRNSDCLSKEEFHVAFVQYLAKQYRWLEQAPQWPLIDGVYYACDYPVIDEATPETGRLDDLISMWRYEDEIRWQIAKAAMITPFLGVYGQKPMIYVYSPDGRGAGKTDFLKTMSYLTGTPMLRFTGRFPNEKERANNFTNARKFVSRVCAFDDMTVSCAESSELNSLLTSEVIEGHAFYEGPADRNNNLTFGMSSNGTKLSHDLVERTVVAEILAHEEGSERNIYEDHAKPFIDRYRREIWQDIGIHIMRKSRPLEKSSRWTAWVKYAVSGLDDPLAVLERIEGAKATWNFNNQNAIEFDALLMYRISQETPSIDPETTTIGVNFSTLIPLLQQVKGRHPKERLDPSAATSELTDMLSGYQFARGTFKNTRWRNGEDRWRWTFVGSKVQNLWSNRRVI